MKLYQISCTVCIFHFLFVYAFNCIVIFEGSRCVYLFAFYTIFLLFWKMLVFSGTFFCLLMWDGAVFLCSVHWNERPVWLPVCHWVAFASSELVYCAFNFYFIRECSELCLPWHSMHECFAVASCYYRCTLTTDICLFLFCSPTITSRFVALFYLVQCCREVDGGILLSVLICGSFFLMQEWISTAYQYANVACKMFFRVHLWGFWSWYNVCNS